MSSLAGIRAEILSGDERPLYLAWLLCVEKREIEEAEEEPPIPPGLADLSPSLVSMIHFLRIDEHRVAAAA